MAVPEKYRVAGATQVSVNTTHVRISDFPFCPFRQAQF
jgi:hypothetical protein